MHIPFNNQYVRLGEKFYAKVLPSPVSQPLLIKFNDELAASIGFSADGHHADEVAALFSGNVIPDGAEPLAMAYSGHQFGHFSPQLGDGRAILLGEVNDLDGISLGLQLKGSGRTCFSRNGDGRAALGPVLREYLVSEAMAKLHVPTTRALAVVATGDNVNRERLLPGGVITRIASSYVRVGTFQFFASRGDIESVKRLADYVIEHNYPQAANAEQPYAAFFKMVIERQARLIAQWMKSGFIHGVMNTDNMSVAGETIDYGPCAFMDQYTHNKVFSSIDQNARYAYNNQPDMGLWNLMRLAESILPLLDNDIDEALEAAQALLKSYMMEYEKAWLSGMRAKTGLSAIENTDQDDKILIEELLDVMDLNHADFTLTFYYLSQMSIQTTEHDDHCRSLFEQAPQFDDWLEKWRERLKRENQSDDQRQLIMQKVNPAYIPRNHQIEAAIRAAEDNDDFSVFQELHEVLQNPFVLQPGKEKYLLPPEPEEVVHRTFCGT